ncbi:hypothetical protein [Rhodococcus sp. X156]|uniref:hypothetical protein n=1 Tax=Rhodococcus sp. X156 TaxID=2499145 RepID=UPI0013E3AAC4|nr:hypothetical protein [Rhodococcus sp. X156]
MNVTTTGLYAGLLLGIAAAAGGFSGFLIAIVLGILGVAVGAHYDGKLDLGELFRGRNRG